MNKFFLCLITLISLQGCMMGARHADDVDMGQNRGLTIGKVQGQIHKGMTSGQVAEVLGSPNIVSTDENGNENWIYDRISTLGVASGSNGIFTYGSAGAVSTSQRTTTVIIKYDANHRVRDTAYNSSSF